MRPADAAVEQRDALKVGGEEPAADVDGAVDLVVEWELVDVDVPSADAVVFAVMVEMFARLGAAMLASKYHRHHYGLS